MNCKGCKEQLGEFHDGELPTDLRDKIESHVATCSECACELECIRALASRMTAAGSLRAPVDLWDAIERRIEVPPRSIRPSARGFSRGRRYAIVASVLFAVLIGSGALYRFGAGESVANASTVDFGVLLDGLSTDAVAAFEKFLSRYHAKPMDPAAAKRAASQLDFDIPEALPGGFKLQKSYHLEFGGEAGAAATYSRNGEFLGAIFHRPVQREEFGTHKDYECVVGQHRGHAVAVGDWKLVHLTDPQTCHCVLSKLDESTELPQVMAKIAPKSLSGPRSSEYSHGHGH